MISFALAGGTRAATYGWSGLGGNNLWSNGNNWTNVADSSTGTAPGAADEARFADEENDVVAINADTAANIVQLGNGGMMITGAYTLTINAAQDGLIQRATYYGGGSARIDCNVSFPNLNATGNKFVNWNQVVTINGNVSVPGGLTTQFGVNGNGTGKLILNGQLLLTSAGNTDVRTFGNVGDTEFATQYSPPNYIRSRIGTLILKGNVGAPLGETAQNVATVGFDGNTPRRIWIASANGASVFSNRFLIAPLGADSGKYQEFRVKAPTTVANFIGQMRIDHTVWWFVDSGCLARIKTLNKGDSKTDIPVYMSGGGTTEVYGAASTQFPHKFILSNGVFLVNNTSGEATHGPVTVCASGVFGGAGSIRGNVSCESGGVVSPGNSVGTLTVSNATFAAGGILHWEVNHPNADKLNVLDVLNVSAGAVTVKVVNAGSIQAGTTYEAFGYKTLTGNMQDDIVVDVSGLAGITAQVEATAGGIGIVLVPEPALAGLAGLALLAVRRRK